MADVGRLPRPLSRFPSRARHGSAFYVNMATSNIYRRVLVYLLLSCTIGWFVLYIFSYECIRCYGPRQPNVLTGQIYAQRLQQPFDVYLTRFQVVWLQYGIAPMLPLMLIVYFLNLRWKIFHNPYYDIPKNLY